VKRLFSDAEHGRVSAFVTNLNFIAKAHGIILDSESPIIIAVDGLATPLSVVYDDEAESYDVHVGVPL
jgi:hypothetical protein